MTDAHAADHRTRNIVLIVLAALLVLAVLAILGVVLVTDGDGGTGPATGILLGLGVTS